MINLQTFKSIFQNAKNPSEWVNQLENILPIYDINTKERVCAFLAQTGHESAYYTALQENLNYSAQGLLKIFGKYFRTRDPNDYARNPEAIANVVYSNRLGNGDEDSGDGWKYRGRGLIQVTGKTNYANCSDFLFQNETLLDTPELLVQPEYAIHSACWYWYVNDLNNLADDQNMTALTKRINGGTNGLEDRLDLYDKLWENYGERMGFFKY